MKFFVVVGVEDVGDGGLERVRGFVCELYECVKGGEGFCLFYLCVGEL